jgi:acetyltransferase-like isoleucine patch superfamily enzyme
MLKNRFKKLFKSNYTLYTVSSKMLFLLKSRKNYSNVIKNNGCARIIKDILGKNNLVIIGKNSILHSTMVRIRGNNNMINVGSNCTIGPKCSFWIEGNNIEITIRDNCSFTSSVHFNAQENGSKILVGDDCMFSNNIIVRTSDSHPIYDIITGKRINHAKSVFIGSHVWIAPNSKVMKGAIINDGAIIGSDTIVTKEIPWSC